MKSKLILLLLPLAICLSGSCKKSASGSPPVLPPADTSSPRQSFFAKGADISWLTQMESAGYAFYDSTGTKKDCLQLLQSLGFNSIRLRAWVNPADGWCNTTDLLTKALRAKALGMRIMIDFHYSDRWADPGHQFKPQAWSPLTGDSLSAAVYQYTYRVMDSLKSAGILPDWVQVGNETNDGMLWEDGRASTHMAAFAALVQAGYRAVKAVSDSSRVIVHISNGYDNTLFRWIFDGLRAAGAHWDIIGMSLYPSTGGWSGVDAGCLANMLDMVSRYSTPVMICEVGMDVTQPDITRSFLEDILKKTRSVPGENGLGVFYWEPESYNNWQGYTLGAFDNNGRPTSALNAFRP